MRAMRIMVTALLLWALLVTGAAAEKTSGWVMCQPDSMVNIREKPDKNSDVVAWGYMGDEITLDGRKKGKWLHVIIPCETGEGWIRSDYVSEDPPEDVGSGVFRVEKNNTFARTSAGGKIRLRMKAGKELTVHMVTALWCVTSEGFVRTECLIEVSRP